MGEKRESVNLLFYDVLGRNIGEMQIYSVSADYLQLLTIEEAREFGEEQVQLLEDRVYEYQILRMPPGWKLLENPAIIPSKVSKNTGRIDPASYTGILPIIFINEHNHETATGRVEVRSAKLNYRDDYRRMLDDIATFSTDLVVDVRAPSQVRLLPNVYKSPETIQQQFAFLKSIIGTRSFRDALQRVISVPHSQLEIREEDRDIRRSGKLSGKNLLQIARAPKRIPLPEEHELFPVLLSYGVIPPSIPHTLPQIVKRETRDTPENRFVKYALNTFVNFLTDMERAVPRHDVSHVRLREDIEILREQLVTTLAQDFFRDISEAKVLPLSSPVLQRKPGYREILNAWLNFNIAGSLVWHGGNDVYGAGKRNVARLYEYWVFFALLRLVRKHFDIDIKSLRSLFEKHEYGLGLRLKQGKSLTIKGSYTHGERSMSLSFSYNRTFTTTNPPTVSGSWTKQMRPDYTLSIYPEAFTEEQAEAQHLIAHIHFDAKYKVESLEALFGKERETDENDEYAGEIGIDSDFGREPRQGAKREDLLKMHAYLDAIRRSEGAYVIYPGSQNHRWQAYQEIFPGLGAFRLRPGQNSKIVGGEEISKFLGLVLEHLMNRATRWERQTYYDQFIQYSPAPFSVLGQVPEKQRHTDLRIIPLSDQIVLVGHINPKQLNWVETHSKFVLKLNDQTLDQSQVLATYIFLIGSTLPVLLEVSGSAEICTYSDLIKLQYPILGTEEGFFLVFSIEASNSFQRWSWNTDAMAAIGQMTSLTLAHLLFHGNFQ